MLGGITTQQKEHQDRSRDKVIRELRKEIDELKEQKKTFKLCPSLLGTRYEKIILPDSHEELLSWIHTELLPTLTLEGSIKGTIDFIK